MAKASLVAANIAKDLAAIKEQLDRIEQMLKELREQPDNTPAQEVKPKK